MALVFVPGPHRYELDGVVVPSVTAIIRPAHRVDFTAQPMIDLAAALERGTRVHQAVSLWNDKRLDELSFAHDFPTYFPYLQAWIRFCERSRFVPLLNEHRVASRRHQLAGTIDCLGLLDGHRCLIELKTGSPADVAADLQLAAYDMLTREWAREQDADPRLADFLPKGAVLKRYAVQVSNDGRFKVEAYADAGDYREFIVGLQWYHICARRKRVAITETAA